MKLSRRTLSTAIALALGTLCSAGMAQTKWDLPAGYPATNFHSVNLAEFASDVDGMEVCGGVSGRQVPFGLGHAGAAQRAEGQGDGG